MDYFSLTPESSLSSYIKAISVFPTLTEQEEKYFSKEFYENKCVKSAHKIITSHLRLVIKIAMQFKKYKVSIMDMIGEGNVALVYALKKFDPYKGFRFSTYAMWWIKSYIANYVMNSLSLVRSSSSRKKVANGIKEVGKKINNFLDAPRDSSLSSGSNSRVYGIRCVSLNNNSDPSFDISNSIPCNDSNQEEVIIKNTSSLARRKFLINAVQNLNEREKVILINRRLIENPKPLRFFADLYGISCERVRQIENSIIRKIKKQLEKEIDL